MSAYTTTEEFHEAYNTLHTSYKTGKTKSLKWRKWQLKQLFWLINDNEQALADAMKQDLNKHPFEAVALELIGIKGDILGALSKCEKWARGEAPAEAGFVMGTLAKAWLRKEPLGVAFIIGAWNYPFSTAIGPVVGAIAAGNCVMLKPSELAPACQNLLANLAAKYLDQSTIRVCTGGAQETGCMLEHKFNHIFYTGGSKVGRIIATAAAKHLTPVVLELGGQAPAIVTRTANIDLSAKRLASSKLTNSGQVCLSVNHVLVDPAIHDEFADRVVFWMQQFLKHGTDDLATIISDGHFARVTGLLKRTRGRIIFGGDNNASRKFVHPTIITDVEASDSLLSEELFCPFVPIIKADVQTAISIVSSMPHPLGLYIFSNDQQEIDYILNNTTSGGVTINDVMMHAGVPSAPFGGVGESGYGSYKDKYGFEAFSHTRTVVTMPSYLESFLSWRYAPRKLENKKHIERLLPKVDFKRGEGFEDQKIRGPGKSLMTTVGLCVVVFGILVVGDYMTGSRLGLGNTFGGVFGS